MCIIPTFKTLKTKYGLDVKDQERVVVYSCRPLGFGNVEIDVRAFFINPVTYELQEIVKQYASTSEKDRVYALFEWVINNIQYTPDKTQFGLEEVWLFPQETLFSRTGDCEDGAILLANLLATSGIPFWKIRIVATNSHAYVAYYNTKSNNWLVFDWTRPTLCPANMADSDWNSSEDIVFFFNSRQAYSKLMESK